MIKFKNNSEPDITDENLNKMQQDIGTVVSATEPQGDERLKVWIKKGKNLLNPIECENAYMDQSNGSIIAQSTALTTGYIPCKEGSEYILSGTYDRNRWAFYDENKELISFVYEIKVTPPAKAKYLRCYFYASYSGKIPDAQIEQNSISTSYEAYIKPKIYVLNNNGVYEELMKKEDISNELYYKSGDKFITSYGTYYGGTLTGSLKNISFTIPFPKSTKNIKNITINSIKITVRDVKGQYLLNGVTKDTFNGNFTIEKRTDYLYTIYLSSNTAFESINNTPVAVALDSIDLNFN